MEPALDMSYKDLYLCTKEIQLINTKLRTG